MTLDVNIGKVVVCMENNKPEFTIENCPNAEYDICDDECTIFPRSSIRSGSTGFWEFWRKHCNDLYECFRNHPSTNDIDVSYLKPYIDDIKSLPDKCIGEGDEDRMKWFKHWAVEAVKLYGDDAGIMFS